MLNAVNSKRRSLSQYLYLLSLDELSNGIVANEVNRFLGKIDQVVVSIAGMLALLSPFLPKRKKKIFFFISTTHPGKVN